MKCELDIDQNFLFVEQSDRLCSQYKILGVDILGVDILRIDIFANYIFAFTLLV